MSKLSNTMSRLAKLLRRVSCGKGSGTVPDLEGCLRDCTSCLEDDTKEEWGNLLEPIVRMVVDKLQELMDMVKLAWEEMGVEDKQHMQSPAERSGGRGEVSSENIRVPQHYEAIVKENTDLNLYLNVNTADEIIDRDSVPYRHAYDQADLIFTTGNSMGSNCPQDPAKSDQSDGPRVTSSVRPGQAHSVPPVLDQLSSIEQDCRPLASSTPRSGRNLSSCLPVGCDHLQAAGNDASSESESGLLETGELLRLVEQFTGVEPSPRLRQELVKLERGTGLIRWRSFEKRLEEDPAIVFGEE
jgi:hypothetical protein